MIYDKTKDTIFEAFGLDIEETDKYLVSLIEDLSKEDANPAEIFGERLNSPETPENLRLAIVFFWGKVQGRQEGFDLGFEQGAKAVVSQSQSMLKSVGDIH